MRVMLTGTRFGAFALAVTLLSGCALFGGGNDDESDDDLPQVSEQELYQQARASLESGRYSSAVEELEAVDSRFPFGDYAEQAQLELIYAYYQTDNWEAARASAGRFIRLQPDHPQVDYAYYMRGLSAYQAGRFSLERLRLVDLSRRDLGASRDAYSDFSELIQRYPDSEYAPDARQRIIYLRNVLAAQELHVADFYLRKGAYLAAVQRGRWVIENYPESTANRDALAVMVEGYLGLGMRDRAREVLSTLIENDPRHERLSGRTFRPLHVNADSISA
ncbi:Beta-barrel assembly machine subunit BamD [Franzmannia pantelleriensis]|uniref:Outer membrane protein assembly factor BamD n=1 Tax=Franzmannia pantelleriensis TaxID=48727 RepID=A0A1G9U3Y8_9GAMM|nr:outer membrane protein assembly factor BamD [Halomonas pantelleriensis]SDM54602.1 Beta-barrel assembly machine subunit BamD [Halomonas pantelleriensis]